ncbi:hypothetical protein PybrP1_000834 [[Pythium] brassicae (nom. inval.)]|nr:hypothetical protein PybrP1_000834 [[Pythium] brassicae (nom. inval.)]
MAVSPNASTAPRHGRAFGAVFDLDGTLLDTEGISEQAIDRVVAAHGRRHSTALHKTLLGRPSAEWTSMVLDAFELHGVLEPLELAREWERHLHAMLPEVRALPGALELLRELHARGVPLALATSSSTHAVAAKRAAHPELFAYFAVVVCGDDPLVARGKPEPDIFLLAAKRLRAAVAAARGGAGAGAAGDAGAEELPRCVVFEDSALGVQAGNAAGMFTVAVPDARIYEDAAERQALYAHADVIIASLADFRPEHHGW